MSTGRAAPAAAPWTRGAFLWGRVAAVRSVTPSAVPPGCCGRRGSRRPFQKLGRVLSLRQAAVCLWMSRRPLCSGSADPSVPSRLPAEPGVALGEARASRAARHLGRAAPVCPAAAGGRLPAAGRRVEPEPERVGLTEGGFLQTVRGRRSRNRSHRAGAEEGPLGFYNLRAGTASSA